jgi:predicted DNA-binding ArsR family transcriptional regulator
MRFHPREPEKTYEEYFTFQSAMLHGEKSGMNDIVEAIVKLREDREEYVHVR